MASTELATLGAGCFWCVDSIFRQLRGVGQVESGYAGGKSTNPTYEEVCSGNTKYVEVIRINFDPGTVTYEQLLDVFFHTHDPTTQDRQGNDVGSQYRSAIFFHSDDQEKIAREVIKQLDASKTFRRTDCYGSKTFDKLLFGRRISSRLLQQPSNPALLPFNNWS